MMVMVRVACFFASTLGSRGFEFSSLVDNAARLGGHHVHELGTNHHLHDPMPPPARTGSNTDVIFALSAGSRPHCIGSRS